jgi:beta-glucanase (GH16 family)
MFKDYPPGKFFIKKRWTCIFMILLFSILTTCITTSEIMESEIEWKLIFSDEFAYDGNPDPTKWSFEIQPPGWVNDEKQIYTGRQENARVENGVLIIEARKDGFRGYPYSSARIKTQNKFDFLYGRIEVRAKLPKGRGTWPAIWLMPAKLYAYGTGWPHSGEIDIMEHVGHKPGWIHASIHTGKYNWPMGTQKTAKIRIRDFHDSYHIYGMEWYPDRITIFIDTKKLLTFRNKGKGWTSWPFDKPFYVILNIAVGGNWGGARGIDDSIFPQQMIIDYVRVYQMNAE